MVLAPTAQRRWSPSVTVAAIIERDGRFLFVEEQDKQTGAQVFNQPAGHLEAGETLAQAVSRETREESGYRFEPKALVGIYHFLASNQKTYLRFTFCGQFEPPEADVPELDSDIIAVHWLRYEEIKSKPLRSPIVIQSLDDYLAGKRTTHSLITSVL